MIRTAALHALEPRRLLSTSIAAVPASLIVNGTSKDDVIEIKGEAVKKVRYVRVIVNGKTTARYKTSDLHSITVSGRSGNDRIVDRGAFDGIVINGDGGKDRIDAASGRAVIRGGSGNDSLVNTGGGGAVIVGDSGDDTLYGGGGDDTLFGGLGADVVDGRGGAGDVYTNGDASRVGEYGTMFDAAISVSLDDVANDGRAGERDNVRGCEQFVGSARGDSMNFSRAASRVVVLDDFNAGPDSIVGSAFDDYLASARGDESVGDDAPGATIRGGGGNDILKASAGRDFLYGDGGDDELVSLDDYDDYLSGGTGDDLLQDAAGNDTLVGGSGDDILINTGETASIHYVDELRGSSGYDQLYGRRDDNDLLSSIEEVDYT